MKIMILIKKVSQTFNPKYHIKLYLNFLDHSEHMISDQNRMMKIDDNTDPGVLESSI